MAKSSRELGDPMKRTRKISRRKRSAAKKTSVAALSRAPRKPAVHQFERDLGKTAANHVPLTPLSFLPRAAHVFPRHDAIVHGRIRRTWAQIYRRCRQLASALRRQGIKPGDTVALMAPNIPAAYEAAFGVPMAGAGLETIKIPPHPAVIAVILAHPPTPIIVTHTGVAPRIHQTLVRT